MQSSFNTQNLQHNSFLPRNNSIAQTSTSIRDTSQNEIPILFACLTGNAELLKEEIKKDPFAIHQIYTLQDTGRSSPLICIAASKGHLEIIKILINHGSSVNSRNDKANSPLLIASALGHFEIVKFLLENDTRTADINIFNNQHITALGMAAFHGQEKIVSYLLNYDIDVNHVSYNEDAPEHTYTPLYYAAKAGNIKIVEDLIKCGAKINILCGKYRETPLANAAANGHIQIVKLLVQSGADMNMRDWRRSNSLYPITLACINKRTDIVRLLLKSGAEVRNDSALYTMDKLRKEKSPAIYEILQSYKRQAYKERLTSKHGIKNLRLESFMVTACRYGNIAWLKEEIRDKPFAIFSTHQSGGLAGQYNKSLLYISSKHGHQDIVNLLIRRGVDVNQQNEDGTFPLYAAVKKGHHEIVKTLLRHGADISKIDKCIKVAAKNKDDLTLDILNRAKEDSESLKKRSEYPERFTYNNLGFV